MIVSGGSGAVPARRRLAIPNHEQAASRESLLKAYLEKVRKDNIRFLTAAVAWHILASVIPILIGLVAVTNLLLPSASQKHVIIDQLGRASQGVLSSPYLEHLYNLTLRHSGLFTLIAALGIAWAAEQVGFGLSCAFDAMFEVRQRSFLREKLIHLGMFIVFVGLMLLIVAVSTARLNLNHAIAHSSFPDAFRFPITTATSFVLAFVLFTVIYLVYPNTKTHLRFKHVWQGALPAAVLFQLLTFIWPVYVTHLSKYGGVLVPIVVLVLWIYFFSLILVLGAEVAAITAIRDAKRHGEDVGPPPDGSVPQHGTLRQEPVS